MDELTGRGNAGGCKGDRLNVAGSTLAQGPVCKRAVEGGLIIKLPFRNNNPAGWRSRRRRNSQFSLCTFREGVVAMRMGVGAEATEDKSHQMKKRKTREKDNKSERERS